MQELLNITKDSGNTTNTIIGLFRHLQQESLRVEDDSLKMEDKDLNRGDESLRLENESGIYGIVYAMCL